MTRYTDDSEKDDCNNNGNSKNIFPFSAIYLQGQQT